MNAGLQCSVDGWLPEPETMATMAASGLLVARVEAGPNPAEIASHLSAAGLRPLLICFTLDQMRQVPQGCDVELGNEPDLHHANNPWPGTSYQDAIPEACAIAEERGLRLWIGAVSNPNDRGLRFLRSIDWASLPDWVGCSHHWYPTPPSVMAGHDGRTHEEEVSAVRAIVGATRALALTELGYGEKDYTSELVDAGLAMQRAFHQAHGYEFIVAYQLVDAPPDSPGWHAGERYGFQTHDRQWKPARVEAWTGEPFVLEPPPEPPVVDEWRELSATLTSDNPDVEFLSPVKMRVRSWPTPVPPEPIPPEPIPIPPTPPISDVALLNGYMRPGTTSRAWGDDTGNRSIRFCSKFDLIGDFYRRPDYARRCLDKMMGRYQGWRGFWNLLHPGAWVPMNSSVDPFASWFDVAFRTALEESWARGLRLELTAGDLQFLPAGTNLNTLFERIAHQCKAVNEQVIGIRQMVNEDRVNGNLGPARLAELSKLTQAIYPWGMHSLSDGMAPEPDGAEDPATVRSFARPPANTGTVHGTRTPWQKAIGRAFNLAYEGVPGLRLLEDEPNGMDTDGIDPGVTDGTTNRAAIFGLYAVQILTGQAHVHFDSAGLGWHHYELDREWGFNELPALWKALAIPEDIATWKLIPGHKAEAPITMRSFADQGSGPARSDNIMKPDGSAGYNVSHGGTGKYEPIARQSCTYKYWAWDGPFAESTTGGGAMQHIDSARQAVVIRWHR